MPMQDLDREEVRNWESGYQSEAQLEDLLVKDLMKKGYERVSIPDSDELERNFRNMLYKFNQDKEILFKHFFRFQRGRLRFRAACKPERGLGAHDPLRHLVRRQDRQQPGEARRHAAEHAGVDEIGADEGGDDARVPATELQAQRFVEADHRELARRIAGEAGKADRAEDRPQVDDRAAPRRLHRRDRPAGEVGCDRAAGAASGRAH